VVLFDPDRCRSLLFVPAGNERYLQSALRGDADVIQLDLEDAITPDQKDGARESAVSALELIHAAGRVASVRVNSESALLSLDLNAVIGPHLSALTAPKIDSAESLQMLDKVITGIEQERGIPIGQVRLIAQIESARGVLNAREIASSTTRLAAVGIGTEDLSADLGGQVNSETLKFPNAQVLYAAREAGVIPIGYPGSITVYNEADTFQEWIQKAKSEGFEGGFCIHPNQVEILNQEMRPSDDEVEEAVAIVQALEESESKGAFSHNGRMVDAPVIERAHRVLRRHDFFN
jgi:citrate lyase subunit beta/citryl-CoA lyase